MKTSRLPGVIAPDQLARALESNPAIRLLDVRTPAEFSSSRLEGSHNVPLDQLEAHGAEISRVRDPVVIVCRSDARARAAEDVLRRQGMQNVHVLEGGLIAWRRQGLPVRKDPKSPADMLRRGMGVFGIGLAVFYVKQNPIFALMLAFIGFRMASGQSAMPCAVAGTCAIPGRDTSSTVRALVGE